MLDLTGLSWRKSVLICVENLGLKEFTVQEMYENFTAVLSNRFPKNTKIHAGIRRELQHLRDDGYLAQGPVRGIWLYLPKIHRVENSPNIRNFKIQISPLPNYPLSELHETVPSFSGGGQRDTDFDKYLGSLGEDVVLYHEKTRLEKAGLNKLAKRVEQVSVTKGDAEGYDILSFNGDGSEKWIEVKTTRQSISTKFYISEHQIRCADLFPNRYWLFRLYDFDFELSKSKMYCVPGPLRGKLRLTPEKYSALPL